MINNVTLVGRLTKDPEIKYTQSGIAVTTVNLAVDRNYKNAQGEIETDFIQVVAWRQDAEAMASFSVKGSMIGIVGNIQTRNYQNNQGQTVYVTEVVANSFQALETKAQTDARRSQSGQGQQGMRQEQPGAGKHNQMQGQQGGYNRPQGYQNAQTNQGQQYNVSQDDPFMDAPNQNNPFENNQTQSNANPFEDISSDGMPFAD